MDFTTKRYRQLLLTLTKHNYIILPYKAFINTQESNRVALRHDVDRLPQNSLLIANLEAELGIKGSYYFRIVPESFDVSIIKQIAELGHEIGYHYEDVDLVLKGQMSNGKGQKLSEEKLIDLAYESFCENLEKMRKIADIKTICMHGSPRSKYDNKLIWSQRDAFGTKYNYKDLEIIGEPYLDINWNEVGYLTDTGRRWNGVAVRDKVKSKNEKLKSNLKTTQNVIDNIDKLPDKLMITIHPERWTDNWYLWGKQLILQNAKNVVKRVVGRKK